MKLILKIILIELCVSPIFIPIALMLEYTNKCNDNLIYLYIGCIILIIVTLEIGYRFKKYLLNKFK